ncbi:MAG: hypothetical protein WCF07_06115 [Nitrososphaeraceae archaeon]|jgi:hypothetical protein
MSLTRKNSNDVAKENGKGILIQYGTKIPSSAAVVTLEQNLGVRFYR